VIADPQAGREGNAAAGPGPRRSAPRQALLLDAAARLAEMPVYAARLTYDALRAGAPPWQVAPRPQNLARRRYA